MAGNWTPEQVIALAPDASSAKAGRDLATPRKWQGLGQAGAAIWGECQGSAKDPYRTSIDLAEPAFTCTCPSRKFPCKHALGLFLGYVQNEALYEHTEAPAWVSAWLASRSARAAKRADKAEKPTLKRDEVADPAAQARRAAQRAANVESGIADLERWLSDLIRRGLAYAQSQPHSFWTNQAARLIDAQAPGLATLVVDASGTPASGTGWESRLLAQLSRMHLLIKAYRRLDCLPSGSQSDVRTAIGWSIPQEEVLASPGLRANWAVVGRRVTDEAKLRVQRTWLWAGEYRRAASILHFLVGQQPLDTSLVPGTALDAEVAFYPSAFAQRACVKARHGAVQPITALPGATTIGAAVQAHAEMISRQPWLHSSLVVLEGVVPIRRHTRAWLVDAERRALPVASIFEHTWTLLALSGGYPITLCSEFDGEAVLPLGALADDRFLVL